MVLRDINYRFLHQGENLQISPIQKLVLMAPRSITSHSNNNSNKRQFRVAGVIVPGGPPGHKCQWLRKQCGTSVLAAAGLISPGPQWSSPIVLDSCSAAPKRGPVPGTGTLGVQGHSVSQGEFCPAPEVTWVFREAFSPCFPPGCHPNSFSPLLFRFTVQLFLFSSFSFTSNWPGCLGICPMS